MEFITDRTYTDVLKLIDYQKMGWLNMDKEERQEWLAGMKGAFNCTDMNRINAALNFIEKRCAIKDTVKIPYSIENTTISSNDYKYVYICDIEEGYYADVFNGATMYHCVPNELHRIEIVGDELSLTFHTDDGELPPVIPDCYVGGSNTKFPFGEYALKTDYTINEYLTYSKFKKTIDKYNELYPRCNVIQNPNNSVLVEKKPNFQFFNRLEELLKSGYEFLEQHDKHLPSTDEDFVYPIEWKNGYTIDNTGVIVENENYSMSNPIPLKYDNITIFITKDVGSVALTIASYIYSYEAKDYVQGGRANIDAVMGYKDNNKLTFEYYNDRQAIGIVAKTSQIEAIKVQCKAV